MQLANVGCNDIGDLTPVDASDERSFSDAPALECAGDVPVMQYLDTSGKLVDGDWSCYQGDAASFAPILVPTDAGDEAGLVDADLPDAAVGLDAGVDTGVDAAPPPVDAGLPGDAATPADAGAPTSRFRLTDFTTMMPAGGAAVDIFFGNDPSGAPDVSAMTASADAGAAVGTFTFLTGPQDRLYAYRISSAKSATQGPNAPIDLVWFDNVPTPAGGTFEGNSISQGSEALLLTGIGLEKAAGTTLVTAGVRDCKYRDVQGGIIELIDDATGQPVQSGTKPNELHTAYFNSDHLPDTKCTHTVASPSLWSAINVPTDHSYSIRVSGKMSASDVAPRVLGVRKVPKLGDMAVIIRGYRLSRP